MIRIVTGDGEPFEGRSYMEVVRQMKNTQWLALDTKREYIFQVVDRVTDLTGVFPDPSDNLYSGDEEGAKSFVEYLASAGVIVLTNHA